MTLEGYRAWKAASVAKRTGNSVTDEPTRFVQPGVDADAARADENDGDAPAK